LPAAVVLDTLKSLPTTRSPPIVEVAEPLAVSTPSIVILLVLLISVAASATVITRMAAKIVTKRYLIGLLIFLMGFKLNNNYKNI